MQRIALCLAAGVLSAAVWGFATRLAFVPAVIVLTETAAAWFEPLDPARWRVARRLARALVAGGMWAAIGLLAFGKCGGPS